MSYATVDDMIMRYGQQELIELTDLDNIPPVDVDSTRISLKLADASAFVDGYVGQVYRLPLRGCRKPAAAAGAIPEYAHPPVLVRLVCDIARFYLYDDLAPENEVYRRYQAALKELDNIATGRTQLACPWGGSPGVLISADAQTGLEVHSCFAPRAVTDDALRGFD